MSVQTHAVEDSFDSMSRQIIHIMDEMTRRSYYRFSKSATWEPAVNIHEDDRNLYLCVELAGLTRGEVQVEIAGNKLRVHGERPVPTVPNSPNAGIILHLEINSGTFERTIELPDRADPSRIEAKLDLGLLWITVGKRGT